MGKGLAALPVLLATVVTFAGCGPKEQPKPPTPPPAPIEAQPASGDLSWSVENQNHPLRAGAASLGPGGRLELQFVDAKVDKPCDVVESMRDTHVGPERVRVEVPRGVDVDYPLDRTVSPEPLALLPMDKKAESSGARLVYRYGLQLQSIEWKPGGRVTGKIAWVSPLPQSFGEGKFDLPLCASQAQLDAVDKVSKAHPIDPKGAVKGKTMNAPFTYARAFADLGTWHGLPPHIVRIALSSDPLASCTARGGPHTTSVVVDIDSETGLGKHNATRQPIRDAKCESNHVTWSCFGERELVRGFIDLREADLRVGGIVRGTLAIEGDKGSAVSGAFDVEVCKPD